MMSVNCDQRLTALDLPNREPVKTEKGHRFARHG